jgi:hypothetical protein
MLSAVKFYIISEPTGSGKGYFEACYLTTLLSATISQRPQTVSDKSVLVFNGLQMYAYYFKNPHLLVL